MSVSIVIPAYRAATTIGRAVDSVLAQTRQPDEILVIDDGSPDDLAAALRPYGERVRLLRKSNGGAASARNLGIDRSRGDWIAFIDADDYWEPDKLQRQLDVAERHPEVGLSAARYYDQVPGSPREAAQDDVPPKLLDRVLKPSGAAVLEVATSVWTSTVLVRREALGAERFDTTLVTAEDRDLWIRIAAAWPTYILSAPLATRVKEPGSLSRAATVDFDCGNMMRVVQRHSGLLGRRGLRYWEARVYRQWASILLYNGRTQEARAAAWQRLWRQPLSPEGWWIFLKCIYATWTHSCCVRRSAAASPNASAGVSVKH